MYDERELVRLHYTVAIELLEELKTGLKNRVLILESAPTQSVEIGRTFDSYQEALK